VVPKIIKDKSTNFIFNTTYMEGTNVNKTAIIREWRLKVGKPRGWAVWFGCLWCLLEELFLHIFEGAAHCTYDLGYVAL
jgi:hypothetical protein